MRRVLFVFFEKLYFRPNKLLYLVALPLLPISLLYALALSAMRRFVKARSFALPIISIGNITLGGSGKTPFTMLLAKRYAAGVVVILRGYGRQSRGLFVVSSRGEIGCSVECAGDEAMMMARELKDATVIVCEDRLEAIRFAIAKLKPKVILLDDAFSHPEIEKFDIVLLPKSIPNRFSFPYGPMRGSYRQLKYADMVLKEGRDFNRVVKIDEHKFDRLLLLSAISNPNRLEPYLPKEVVGRYLLEDHSFFDETKIQARMEQVQAQALLVTEKDAVKLEKFKFDIVKMRLQLAVDEHLLKKIDRGVF